MCTLRVNFGVGQKMKYFAAYGSDVIRTLQSESKKNSILRWIFVYFYAIFGILWDNGGLAIAAMWQFNCFKMHFVAHFAPYIDHELSRDFRNQPLFLASRQDETESLRMRKIYDGWRRHDTAVRITPPLQLVGITAQSRRPDARCLAITISVQRLSFITPALPSSVYATAPRIRVQRIQPLSSLPSSLYFNPPSTAYPSAYT